MKNATVLQKNKGLPEGWRWVEISKVAKIFSGSPAPQEKKYYEGGKFPFVKVSDLGVSKKNLDLKSVKYYVNEECVKKENLVLAKKGTLLFPKSGAAIMTNNRALLSVDSYIVSHLAAIEPLTKELDPKYLYYFFYNLDMIKYSENPGYPSLKLSKIKNIKILVPPLQEQRKIVESLDEQMAQIEIMKNEAENQKESISFLFMSFIYKIFQDNSKSWNEVNIQDILKMIYGKGLSERIRIKGKIPVYGSNGIIGYHNQALIDFDTIIIGRKGSAGELNLVKGSSWPIDTTYYVMTEHNLEFIFFLLTYINLTKIIQKGAKPGLNRNDVYRIKVNFPENIKEQEKIVQTIKLKKIEIDILLDSINLEINSISQLPSSILNDIFGQYKSLERYKYDI